MCVVYRVSRDPKFRTIPVVHVYEDSGRVPSSQEMGQGYFYPSSSTTVTAPVPSRSPLELTKKAEIDRTTGRSFTSIPVEDHRLSPQHSTLIGGFGKARDDWYDSTYPGHRNSGHGGFSKRNHGQKPRYKDRALRMEGSGLTRAVNAQF
jgi:hypothetical protein